MEPETWKDILKKKYGGPESSLGHDWIPTGSKGGKQFFIKRSRRSTFAEVLKSPKTIFYKCKKCHTKASKVIGEGSIVADDIELRGLSCDEIMIRDIII